MTYDKFDRRFDQSKTPSIIIGYDWRIVRFEYLVDW